MSFCRKPLTSARVAGGTKVGERMSTEQTGRAWDLPADQRASCVLSLADSLSSIRFHLLRSPSLADENGEDMTAEAELAALMAAAKKVEARAHNDAGVYARTTSGTIPYDDAVIFYAMKCSAALLEMIKDPSLIERSARDGGGAAVADADGALDLSQDQMRGFVNGEWAKKSFESMLDGGAQIRRLKLSTKSFGAEAAQVVHDALSAGGGALCELDASDVIAGRDEEEALRALRIICGGIAKTKVRTLDLSDNAMGEKGLRACAEALQLPSLQKISLQNVGLSVHASGALDEVVGGNAANLRGLYLKNNMSDDAGAVSIAKIISRAPLLEEFRMVSSRVKEVGCEALCGALAACGNLSALDLSDNPFCDKAGPCVSACVRTKSMRSFSLNDMNLGDEAAAEVIESLSTSAPSLEVLELGGNELTKDAMQSLVSCILARSTRLRKLAVPDNELKDAGAIRLAAALPPSLETIDMSSCEIGRAGAVAVAEAVKDFPGLKSVNLDCNFISDEGVEIIQSLLGTKLGSLEDNDPDGYEEEDDDEEDREDDGNADGVAAMMAKSTL